MFISSSISLKVVTCSHTHTYSLYAFALIFRLKINSSHLTQPKICEKN